MTWDYARDLVTIVYDSKATGPNAFTAAIAKLGYEAKSPTMPPSTAAKLALRTQLPVPPDAPKFFVEAIDRAKEANKPLLIDFWAEWCLACRQLKHETLGHPDVVKVLRLVELVYVDLDKYPDLGDAYGVDAIPDVFFVDSSGRLVDRLQNFEPPDAFIARVRNAFALPPS